VQPRDERRSKCKSIPRRPDPLDFSPRSQYLDRRKNEQADSLTLHTLQGAAGPF